MYLPARVKYYVNTQLAAFNDYGGSVGDIRVFLWRGAYRIRDLYIYKTGDNPRTPFIAAETTDLSVEWGALWPSQRLLRTGGGGRIPERIYQVPRRAAQKRAARIAIRYPRGTLHQQ